MSSRGSFVATVIVLTLVAPLLPPAAAQGTVTVSLVTPMGFQANPLLLVTGGGFGASYPGPGTQPLVSLGTSGDANVAPWIASDANSACNLRVLQWSDAQVIVRGVGLGTRACPVERGMRFSLTIRSADDPSASATRNVPLVEADDSVESLTPAYGPETGGTLAIDASAGSVTPQPSGTVRITGSGFSSVRAVLFGNKTLDPSAYTVVSANEIDAIPPAMQASADSVEVAVITDQGATHSSCILVVPCATTYWYLKTRAVSQSIQVTIPADASVTPQAQGPRDDTGEAPGTGVCTGDVSVSVGWQVGQITGTVTGTAFVSYPDQFPYFVAALASNMQVHTNPFDATYSLGGSGNLQCDIFLVGVPEVAGVYLHFEGRVSASGSLTLTTPAGTTSFAGGFAGYAGGLIGTQVVLPQFQHQDCGCSPVVTASGSLSATLIAGVQIELGPEGLQARAGPLIGVGGSWSTSGGLQGDVCYTLLQVALDARFFRSDWGTNFYPLGATSITAAPDQSAASQCPFEDLSGSQASLQVPGAPISIIARDRPDKGQTHVEWQPANDHIPVAGYRVYRGTSPATMALVTTMTSGTSLEESGLQEGTTYDYQVVPFNAAGTGSPSSIATVRTLTNTMSMGFEEFPSGTDIGGAYLGISFGFSQFGATCSADGTPGCFYIGNYGSGPRTSCGIDSATQQSNCVIPMVSVGSAGRTFRSFEATFRYAPYTNGNPNRLHFRAVTQTPTGTHLAIPDAICDMPNMGIARCGISTPDPIIAIAISPECACQSMDDVTITQDVNLHPLASAPQDLTATTWIDRGQVKLHWNASAYTPFTTAVEAYDVYRGTSPDALGLIATVGPSTFSYVDTGLPDSTTYYYAVKAVNGHGEGPTATSSATSRGNQDIMTFDEFPAGSDVTHALLGVNFYTYSRSFYCSYAPCSPGFYGSNDYSNCCGGGSGTTPPQTSCTYDATYNPNQGNCYLPTPQIVSSNGRTFRSFEATFHYRPNTNGQPNRITFQVFRAGDTGQPNLVDQNSFVCDMPNTGVARCGVSVPTPIIAINIQQNMGTTMDDVIITQDITLNPPTTTPQDLQAQTWLDGGQIKLTWNGTAFASFTGAIEAFDIYRGTDPNSLQLVTTVDNSTFTYLDHGLADSTRNYYAVRAANKLGEGPSATANNMTQNNQDTFTFDGLPAGSDVTHAYLGVNLYTYARSYYCSYAPCSPGFYGSNDWCNPSACGTSPPQTSCTYDGIYNPNQGNCYLPTPQVISTNGRTFRSFEASFHYRPNTNGQPNRITFQVYREGAAGQRSFVDDNNFVCDMPDTGVARCGVSTPTPIDAIAIQPTSWMAMDDVTITDSFTLAPISTAVTGLAASPTSTRGQSHLTWNATSYASFTGPPDTYNVYRGSSPSDLQIIQSLSNQTFSYLDSGLQDDVRYLYEIRAQNAQGEGPGAQVSYFIDTIPPTIANHATVTAEATSSRGATVSYQRPATTDNIDPPGLAACAPTSGSQFPVGATTATCTATDQSGNAATPTTFQVIVADTTPPTVDPHQNMTAEATSAAGAVVTYQSPGTEDLVDGPSTATCAPASGSTFALGNTTVTCGAADAHGNRATSTTFTVRVVDTTPPAIDPKPNMLLEATSPQGAMANYTAPSSHDTVDGAGVASCGPATRSIFQLGTTSITCTASDSAGNTGTSSFTVTVVDTTPPRIDAHANVTAEATSTAGAAVQYAPPATHDAVDGEGTANCLRAPNATFPLGTTTVTCFATDANGNRATPVTFNVTVADTTPPAIDPSPNLTAEASGPNGAAVNYQAPATRDLVDGNGTADCAPASGQAFPLGTTIVTCRATDAHGNKANATTFTITVQDTTAPDLTTQDNITITAWDSTGTLVTFLTPNATDVVDGSDPVTCLPASGSTFRTGDNLVTCQATDHANNTGTTTFHVAVVATAPQPPQNVTAASGPGPTNVTLAWTAPTRDGGLVVTAYRVYREGTLVATLTGLSYRDTGLSPNATYRYDITALNDAGPSFSSSVKASTSPPPTAPQNLTAQPGTQPGDVGLSWQAPAQTFGLPLLEYRIYEVNGTNLSYLGSTTGTSFTATGCQAAKQCTFLVRAVTIAGEGASSNQASSPGTEARPPNPAVQGNPDGSVAVYNDKNGNGQDDPGEDVATINPNGLA